MPLPITRGALSAIGFGLFSAPAALAADPYFNYVTMLLHGDGTNGAQNNTFLDSSTNNFTITRNGNTTQGTFSPYGSNWSNYFDGSGDYLTLPSNAAFTFGTGDFTVEGWIYISAYGVVNSTGIFQQGTSSFPSTTVNTVAAGVDQTGKWAIYAKNTVAFSVATVSTGAWVHFALVRSGTTTSLYANGTSVITVSADSTNYTGTFFGIGSFYGTSETNWNGYISNLRVVKGTAVYTSAFTPPTAPLTAITNTSLLTCQSNRFIDNSTNAFAITVNGNPSVQRFSPFSPSAAYSTSTIGGSGYFDGSGDYLSVADNAALDIPGDFTIEMWLYVGSGNVFRAGIVGHRDQGSFSDGTDWVIRVETTDGKIGFGYAASGAYYDMGTYRIGEWGHYAVSRSGSTVRTFKNGVLIATATDSSSWSSTQPFYIGRNVAGYDYVGYISNFRLVKGTAVYTSAFTPPTAPVTAITNTSLLTNFTNGGIFDNAMMNNLETVGNAQISTSVVKFGTGSMAFDGTGDWLTAPNSNGLYIGSGNFTIEGWLYLNALGSSKGIVSQFNSGGSGPGWTLYTKTTNVLEFYGGSGTVTVTGTTAISATTWTHFAVVRNGSTITIYINGTAGGTATNSSFSDDTTALVYVGGRADNAALSLNGYIDDLRITKGYARYTANFTPPTAAFPNQ